MIRNFSYYYYIMIAIAINYSKIVVIVTIICIIFGVNYIYLLIELYKQLLELY